MAESSTNFGPANLFSSSGEVSASMEKNFEGENGHGNASAAVADLDSTEVVGGSVSNGVSDSSGLFSFPLTELNK